jgi:hypothetical protein
VVRQRQLFAKNALRLGAAGLTSTAAGDVAHAGMQMTSPEIREKYSPYVEGATQVAGGMLGPGMLSKLVSPNAARISPTMQQHAAVLKSEGITPTAGDILADRGLRSTESELRGRFDSCQAWSSSSKALASFRSSVPKPSVNQS